MLCNNCIQHPPIRTNGTLDPPNAGWECPNCHKKYHLYVLSKAYQKKVKNMAKNWAKSVEVEYEKAFDYVEGENWI